MNPAGKIVGAGREQTRISDEESKGESDLVSLRVNAAEKVVKTQNDCC